MVAKAELHEKPRFAAENFFLLNDLFRRFQPCEIMIPVAGVNRN